MAAQIENIFVDMVAGDVVEQFQRSIEVAGRRHRSGADDTQDEPVWGLFHQRARVEPGAFEDRLDAAGAHGNTGGQIIQSVHELEPSLAKIEAFVGPGDRVGETVEAKTGNGVADIDCTVGAN